MAHCYVSVVAADANLVTGGNNVSVIVHTGINRGLCAAVAYGFYLLNGIRNLKEAPASRKKFGYKVCTKTKAHNRNAHIIHYIAKLVNLFRSKKLTFIADYYITVAVLCKKLLYAVAGGNLIRGGKKPYS